MSINGVPATDLLAAIGQVAASTGSACHSGTTEPSPVLTAMGHHRDRALEAIRLSLGRWTTDVDIDQTAHLIATDARRLRAQRTA